MECFLFYYIRPHAKFWNPRTTWLCLRKHSTRTNFIALGQPLLREKLTCEISSKAELHSKKTLLMPLPSIGRKLIVERFYPRFMLGDQEQMTKIFLRRKQGRMKRLLKSVNHEKLLILMEVRLMLIVNLFMKKMRGD